MATFSQRQLEQLRELLIMGRDSVVQLPAVFQDQGPVAAQILTQSILQSFDGALSVVMAPPSSPDNSGEFHQIPASPGDRSCVDSGESGKRAAAKDRRGGYKRRRNSNSRIQISETMEDGYAWRKHGQKAIQNAKHPRCYYRCTHKPDQGCLATKQVQVITEEPQKFQTTYFGNHTCSNVTTKSPNFVLDDSKAEDPHLISFEAKTNAALMIEEIINPPVKEEIHEEISGHLIDESTGLPFWTDNLMAYNEEIFMEFGDFEDAFSS